MISSPGQEIQKVLTERRGQTQVNIGSLLYPLSESHRLPYHNGGLCEGLIKRENQTGAEKYCAGEPTARQGGADRAAGARRVPRPARVLPLAGRLHRRPPCVPSADEEASRGVARRL